MLNQPWGQAQTAVARLASPQTVPLRFDEQKRNNGRAAPPLAQADVATWHHTRGEDRMMLWLLATLSVITISWGIAHKLKAVSPAANCTGERCSCRPDDRR